VTECRFLESNRNNHSVPTQQAILFADRQMVESFFLQIDWTTVAMVIGLLASLIAVLFFGRRDRD
jgi:hypothetical protein